MQVRFTPFVYRPLRKFCNTGEPDTSKPVIEPTLPHFLLEDLHNAAFPKEYCNHSFICLQIETLAPPLVYPHLQTARTCFAILFGLGQEDPSSELIFVAFSNLSSPNRFRILQNCPTALCIQIQTDLLFNQNDSNPNTLVC